MGHRRDCAKHAIGFNSYPPNEGIPELRAAFCDWLGRRYGVTKDPDVHVMPLNGTREGLYNAGMALCPEVKNGQRPVVLMPNPFYQVYMLAAISAGAEPYLVPATAETGHLPDFCRRRSSDFEPGRGLLYVLACQSAGGRGGQGLLARL